MLMLMFESIFLVIKRCLNQSSCMSFSHQFMAMTSKMMKLCLNLVGLQSRSFKRKFARKQKENKREEKEMISSSFVDHTQRKNATTGALLITLL